MRDVVILFLHLIVTVVRLARPGGLRSVVAESLLVTHQLRILNRGRKRAPNLRAGERFIAGLCTLFMNPARVLRSASTSWRCSRVDGFRTMADRIRRARRIKSAHKTGNDAIGNAQVR